MQLRVSVFAGNILLCSKHDASNTIFKLAADFVNNTSRHIFLTGKAGTGKTTFLKYIKENTGKNAVVIAPTGVAAINAGGVTMHSFFQLPFGPFIPGTKRGYLQTMIVYPINTVFLKTSALIQIKESCCRNWNFLSLMK